MILKDGYYYDENNNSWDSVEYTEEQAQKFSFSLINCRSCHDCRGCRGCHDCHDCRDCSGCNGWKSNPQRYVSRNIGSRNAQTTIYFDSTHTQVVCSCWTGTIDEFEIRVNSVYPEGVKYGDDYRKLIAFMRKIIGGAL